MTSPPAIPRSFGQYLRSLGPGIIAVLTWLGAGDVVEAGVSGGNYGYALMWVVVVALLMRFLFVSLVAKYQLCNQHGEGVVDGLARLHRAYAPGLLVVTLVMGHVYGAYMAVGVGETWAKMTGLGQTWQWAIPFTVLALVIAFRAIYRWLEIVFKVLLALLSVSFIGVAIWVGAEPLEVLRGTFTFALPARTGPFDSVLLVVGTIGAVGGSVMNLAYPYFLEQKGWRGPQYRRVQMYDFMLAVMVMIVLDLSVWILGAELCRKTGGTISNLEDLTRLLGDVLGQGGRLLFYLGIFAAIFTSIIGHAVGLGAIGAHAHARWRAGPGVALSQDHRHSPVYRFLVVWVLVSPLVWTAPGMPDFVTLTLVGNGLQVLLIPFLAGGLWWITASPRYIGPAHRNRHWENAVMLLVFALALWGAWASVHTVLTLLGRL